MNDLQARLDRAADELTRPAIPPPAVAIRRRGRRRQQRLVAAAVVVVALVAALWGPGAGLFKRGPAAPSATPGPATPTLGLTPPPVGPGQVWPDPPAATEHRPTPWACARSLRACMRSRAELRRFGPAVRPP